MPPEVGVIVAAAGRGTRVGGAPKQYRELAGVPVLLRALRPFTSHPDVACTVVVLPEDDAGSPPDWLRPLLGERLRVAAGGRERTDSVRAGLSILPAECDIVLVHDGARPLVSRATIDAVIGVARGGAGAVAAVPLGDTLKATDPRADGLVVERTVPRDGLWRAQTPQGFPRDLLERAIVAAHEAGARGTDDAELVERLGGTVRIVPDQPSNLKLTTPADFAFAEAWLAATT